MSKSEDKLYEQLTCGTVCKTLRWLKDESIDGGYYVTDNIEIEKQFDLIIDILTQAGWK
jgi:hypothetical protein